MLIENPFIIVALLVMAFLSAFLVLYALIWHSERKSNTDKISRSAKNFEIVFLFENQNLINATAAAEDLITSSHPRQTKWKYLIDQLELDFESVNDTLNAMLDVDTLRLVSNDGTKELICEKQNAYTRISIISTPQSSLPDNVDLHSFNALKAEVQQLRQFSKINPSPIWIENRKGDITWVNDAYISLADKNSYQDEVLMWPPKKLFNTDELDKSETGALHRVSFSGKDNNENWYEVLCIPLEKGHMFMATSIDKIINSEISSSTLSQTLTTVFSQFTSAIAIFGKDRTLELFNPALANLMQLPTGYLVSKPTLVDFLDQLREYGKMPEPKNYHIWRNEIATLEEAAETGGYEEIWTLNDGATFRVSGRPHQNGAIGFVFEDISAEMALTRNFRMQIDMFKNILTALPTAAVVFNHHGERILTNKAYDDLWDTSATKNFANRISIYDCINLWTAQSSKSLFWQDAIEFTLSSPQDKILNHTTHLKDGRSIECAINPLPNKNVLITFTVQKQKTNSPPLQVFGHQKASL